MEKKKQNKKTQQPKDDKKYENENLNIKKRKEKKWINLIYKNQNVY